LDRFERTRIWRVEFPNADPNPASVAVVQASRRQFLAPLTSRLSKRTSPRSRTKRSLKELRQALRGIHSYLPTPFHPTLEIDPEGMRQNAAFYAKAGPTPLSLVVAAGLGELFALDFEEHRAVVSAAVTGAEGRLPVVAGVRGGYRFALRMARNAEEAGADAILVFPPPGGPQTREGQQRYYREIANSVGIGVLIYPRTQKDDWSRLLTELTDQANILGFKDGSGDIALGQSLGPLIRNRLIWTARGEEHALRALPAGATAYATSFASLVPKACLEFWRLGSQGDAQGMENVLRERIAPLAEIRHKLPLPDRSPGFGVAAIKVALEALERAGGSVRPPKLQVTDTAKIAQIALQYAELSEA
jgi:5-dehydro-4-deoxyglucarate dehydratase